MKEYIIALDQGTTSSRAIIFDKQLNIISSAQMPLTQFYPKPGWVEHDPMEIWATQVGVMNQAIAQSGIAVEDIACIGITNQRETTVVWDRETGKPIYNAIVWQCRRTADFVNEIKHKGYETLIQSKTGLLLDAYFSASKIKWILDNVPKAREMAKEGRLQFGTVDSWIIYNLSGREAHVTDMTNASRTMLYNITTLNWDDTLCDLFEIPMSMLPEVKVSTSRFAGANIQGHKIPITGVAGDQQAALFGHLALNVGDAKNTYGTGCFVLMNTGDKPVMSTNGLISTIGIATRDRISYALEGSIFVAGAVVQWLRDELGLIEDAKDTESLALSVLDTHGVVVVPAFTGLGAPYWDMYARGSIMGLTRGSNKAHIVRASLESIAYQTHDVIQAMEEDSGIKVSVMSADGGASKNEFLMQYQSDVLNIEVKRPDMLESTALGAAMLAGLEAGLFESVESLKSIRSYDKSWHASLARETVDDNLMRWHKAIEHSKEWYE